MNTDKVFLFDYGGTLDTGGHHWGRVIWHAYERFLPATDYEAYRNAYVMTERMLGKSNTITPETTFREVLNVKISSQIDFLLTMKTDCESVGSFDEKQARQASSEMASWLYQQTINATEHSRKMLLDLSKTNRIALVSNFYGNLNTVLREFKLDNLFETVVESAQVGIRKPDEAIYKLAIDRMGLQPSDVIVVGDSIKNDIRPAHSLGCTTVWIKGESWSQTAEDTSTVDYEITDIEQVVTLDFRRKIMAHDS